MFKFFKKRSGEPSSWAGLGAIIAGIGMLTKANGVPEAGQALAQSAEQLASGDYATPVAVILSGLMGLLMKEKK